MEKDIISYIELQVSVFFVILGFLLVLSFVKSLLCVCDQVLNLFCKVRCSRVHRRLVSSAKRFINGQSNIFAIQKLECWFLSRSIDIGIDCKLDIRKFVRPLSLITIEKKTAEHLRDSSVHSFSLPISLWMECSRHQSFSTKQSPQMLPETAGEAPIAIADDFVRNTIVTNYMCEE